MAAALPGSCHTTVLHNGGSHYDSDKSLKTAAEVAAEAAAVAIPTGLGPRRRHLLEHHYLYRFFSPLPLVRYVTEIIIANILTRFISLWEDSIDHRACVTTSTVSSPNYLTSHTVSAGRRLQSNIVATATVNWLGPHYLTMNDVDQSEENAGLLNVIPMGIAAA